MSSRSTDRQINIRAVDRSTSTMMGMVRTMRAVGQEIRILTMLMTALAAAEDLATMGGASFMRIARLGLLGVAGALSIGAAVQVTQQGNILPVGQTLPGQFRIVHHDIIRKIAEQQGLIATLKPGSSDLKAFLEVFKKSDATSTKKHETIFKSILMDQSNRIYGGNLPRDLKETANILDFTGGRSLRCPPDGDGFTEGTYGWHTETSGLLIGLSSLETYNTGQEDETTSNNSIMIGLMPAQTIPSLSSWKVRLQLTEVLGVPFDSVLRNSDMMQFYWKTGGDTVNSTLALHLELVDKNGTVISSLRPGQIPIGWVAPTNWTASTWKIGPDCNVQEVTGPPHSQSGVDYWYSKHPAKPFDWKNVNAIYLCFDFTIPLGGGSLPNQFFKIYVDRLVFSQDYVPFYRVNITKYSNKYGGRMERVTVPEILEFAPLKAYGDKVALAHAAPTFFIDVTCLHDPATELVWAGYGVRFDIVF
jgi:hypothetical protein